jgi:ATP-binding cassette subfamily B protein
LRSYIGHVSQKPFLFADSIRVNVAMNNELTDEEIWRYLELAGLKDDVELFGDKLDTQLGEWGINLSGGQKQRLTLARALAAKPKVLFLDDCLSAVDTITEEKILKNLDQHLKDVTLVWVAHRKSTLKYCNHTFELRPMMEGLQ